jgi:hypothetical protein
MWGEAHASGGHRHHREGPPGRLCLGPACARPPPRPPGSDSQPEQPAANQQPPTPTRRTAGRGADCATASERWPGRASCPTLPGRDPDRPALFQLQSPWLAAGVDRATLYACGCWRGSRRWRRWPRISRRHGEAMGGWSWWPGREASADPTRISPPSIAVSGGSAKPPPRNAAAYASRLGPAAAAKCRERTRKTG